MWRAFTGKPTPPAQASEPPSKEDKAAHHLRNTLQFAKDQHRVLSKKQREQDAWQRQFGAAQAAELDSLSGVEFEGFLAGLFRAQGYAAGQNSALKLNDFSLNVRYRLQFKEALCNVRSELTRILFPLVWLRANYICAYINVK